MYKMCGKVKETEKALFFNCLFCHTERIFPVQSLSCCREREGVERRSVIDICKAVLCSMAGLSQLFAWVSSGESVFWELLAAGAPGGSRLHLCRASRWNSTCLTPVCCLYEPASAPVTGFCSDSSLQDGPTGVAGCQVLAGLQLGAVSRAKCFTPFSNVLCRCLQCYFNI